MKSAEQSTAINAFTKRFQSAINEAGSLYAVAKKCGASIPTLKRYLTGSEPSLTMLVRMAATLNVSVEWLATGQGPKRAAKIDDDARGSGASTLSDTSTTGGQIRTRLTNLREFYDGHRLNAMTGIDKERAQALLDGDAEPSAVEIAEICAASNFSPSYLLLGSGLPRLLQSPGDDLFRSASDRSALRDSYKRLENEIAVLLGPLNSCPDFWVHRVDNDAMAPRFVRGDVLIAERGTPPQAHLGTFLVQDRGSEFACLLAQDGNNFRLAFENERVPPMTREVEDVLNPHAPKSFLIIGRVTMHISLKRL